jgi:UDP-N-acetylglucosamine 2-epimerase
MGVTGPIHVCGCPSIDLCRDMPRTSLIGDEAPIVVLQHPVTTEADHAADQIETTRGAIDSFSGRPTVWMWPGQDAGEGAMNRVLRQWALTKPYGVTFRRHFPAVDFLRLLSTCAVLVGNSSVGIRECSYLGVPVVNIGTRQLGRERAANVTDVVYDADEIRRAIRAQLAVRLYPCSTLYGDGQAGARVARHLMEG